MTRQESDALTGAANASAGIHRKALALVGAQIGPWRVVSVDGPWFEIRSDLDDSTRLMKAADLLQLAAGAALNGKACVLAKTPAPEQPIEGVPFMGAGDPSTEGWR